MHFGVETFSLNFVISKDAGDDHRLFSIERDCSEVHELKELVSDPKVKSTPEFGARFAITECKVTLLESRRFAVRTVKASCATNLNMRVFGLVVWAAIGCPDAVAFR